MENASKALLIAGGLLIALIILMIGLYLYSSFRGIQEEIDSSNAAEQINKFNKQFEAYDKGVMRGIDIITIINKAIDYNNKDLGYKIDIEVYIDSSNTLDDKTHKTEIKLVADGLTDGKIYNFSNNYSDKAIYEKLIKSNHPYDVKVFKEFRFFKCTKVEYNNNGRVSKMYFEEISADVLGNKIDYGR